MKKRLLASLIVFGLLLQVWVAPAFALTGFEVISGDVTLQQSGNTFNITSNSSSAIVQWQSFNVNSGQTVNFLLPTNTSSLLNRIIGGNASNILGNINSNGIVLLSNSSGINIGATANINTGGFIASTLNLSNSNYLNDNWVFTRPDGTSPAGILNEGNISTSTGGFVVLAGGAVMNTGNIFAPEGTVHLAVGDEIRISLGENTVVDVVVNQALKSKVDNYQSAISNLGTIDARMVLLQADLLESFYATTINNDGVIKATTTSDLGNSIRIYAFSDDQQALIKNGGVLDVSSQELAFDGGTVEMLGDVIHNTGDIIATGDQGGVIHLLGREVAVYGSSALDASGENGGGQILIGGDYQGKNPEIRNAEKTWVTSNVKIKADAIETGPGGEVIVWADESTQYYGTISAKGGAQSGDGGFVEVSGKQSLNFMGDVDVRADYGETGTLLLDPTNINIVNGAGADDAQLADNQILQADAPATMQIGETTLEGLANTANVILQATNDITIQDLTDNVLDMAQTTGSVTFTADSDSNGAGDFIMLDTNDMIRTQGGDVTIRGVNITTGSFDLGTTGDLDIRSLLINGSITSGAIINAHDADILTVGSNSPLVITGNQTVTNDYWAETDGWNSPISITGDITGGRGAGVSAFGGNGGFTINGDIAAGVGGVYLADENGGPSSTSVMNGNILTSDSVDFDFGGFNNLNFTGNMTGSDIGLWLWAGGDISITGDLTATAGDVYLELDLTGGKTAIVNGNVTATNDIIIDNAWRDDTDIIMNGGISAGNTVTFRLDGDDSSQTINSTVSGNNIVVEANTGLNSTFNFNNTTTATNDVTVTGGVANLSLNSSQLLSAGNNMVFNTDSTVISGNYSAGGNLTVNSNGLTQSGDSSLIADANADGLGTLAINDALNTVNNNVSLQGAQVTWANPITAGTGAVTVSSSQDLTLSQEITADSIGLFVGGDIIDGNAGANNLTATSQITISSSGASGTLGDPLDLNTPILTLYPSTQTSVFSGAVSQINYLASSDSRSSGDSYYDGLINSGLNPNGALLGQVVLNSEIFTFFSESSGQGSTDFLLKPYLVQDPLKTLRGFSTLNSPNETSKHSRPIHPNNLVETPTLPVNSKDIRRAKRLIKKNGRLQLSSAD